MTRVLELAGHFVYSSLKMGMRKRRFFEVHGENLSRKIIMKGTLTIFSEILSFSMKKIVEMDESLSRKYWWGKFL